jgi:hypothetical protein
VNFEDNFIFSKPKQKVSGDLYWWTKYKNQIIIALADCTDHGLPGAFIESIWVYFVWTRVRHPAAKTQACKTNIYFCTVAGSFRIAP